MFKINISYTKQMAPHNHSMYVSTFTFILLLAVTPSLGEL